MLHVWEGKKLTKLGLGSTNFSLERIEVHWGSLGVKPGEVDTKHSVGRSLRDDSDANLRGWKLMDGLKQVLHGQDGHHARWKIDILRRNREHGLKFCPQDAPLVSTVATNRFIGVYSLPLLSRIHTNGELSDPWTDIIEIHPKCVLANGLSIPREA